MSTDLPLVSVVIPSYNYGQYVCEAVESALAQTYPAVEVIVVDDGSTDDTRERLTSYGDRIRYIFQTNQGLSAARNTGIREARGRFVALLDSDDQFHPRKLEIQMALLTQRPELGLVGTETFSDEPLRWPDIPSRCDGHEVVTLERAVLHAPFAPSSAVVRAECFAAVGVFDTALRSVEDRDMWIRIATRYPVAKIPLPLTWYRVTPGSMSRNPERMEHFEQVVLAKAFGLPELSGRRRLRRKALGLANTASAWTFYQAGQPSVAARRLLRSFLFWPFPYQRPEVHESWVRARLLVAVLRRWLFGGRTSPN